jgi:hypothetical protein
MARTATVSSTEVLAGLVESVTFHNEENGFCVLRVKARGQRDLISVLGHAAIIAAGEFVQASGSWVNDRTHGVQADEDLASPPVAEMSPGHRRTASQTLRPPLPPGSQPSRRHSLRDDRICTLLARIDWHQAIQPSRSSWQKTHRRIPGP